MQIDSSFGYEEKSDAEAYIVWLHASSKSRRFEVTQRQESTQSSASSVSLGGQAPVIQLALLDEIKVKVCTNAIIL